jgi:hypothetical protein
MVLIERLSQKLVILEDQFFNLPQVVPADSAIPRQQDCRLKPELALSVRRANVNVRRLVSFIGIEMKPERANTEDGRHRPSLSRKSSLT